ncbi:MAG: PAS domain-containing protein [Planctomycetota bacterium]|jgi:DUF438 domain-containing protein
MDCETHIEFHQGALTAKELEAVFRTLPFDIYFSDAEDINRIFSEPNAKDDKQLKQALGNTVQSCHSEKSVPAVNKMLDALRSGKKDVFESFREKDGKIRHSRYFAVRDSEGNFLGCLGLEQDVTEIIEKANAKK